MHATHRTMAQMFTPPTMDWEDDSLVYNRLQKFRRDVAEKFKGPLAKEKKEVKANYLLGWIQDDVKDYLYSLKEEYEDPEEIWDALSNKYKMKVNELSSFNRLRTLTQGNMSVDQFITAARKLVNDCKYPNDGERLLRDIIVSGINSKSAYTKCVDKGRDLTYDEAVKIIRNEEEIRRQVEFTRPELKHSTEPRMSDVHQMVPEAPREDHYMNDEQVLKMHSRTRSPKQHSPKRGTTSTPGCQYCGYHRTHPREQCFASGKECRTCGKKGHFQKMCRSRASPKKYTESRLDTLEKQIKQLTTTLHRTLSPPSSPDKEYVDCIAQDYTDIELPETRFVKKLTSHPVYQLQERGDTEQMRPIWMSKTRNSTITELTCEVDTGAGCNVMSLKQAKELYQSE